MSKTYSKVVCTLTIISEEDYVSGSNSFTGCDIEDMSRMCDDYHFVQEISKEHLTKEEAEKEIARLRQEVRS